MKKLFITLFIVLGISFHLIAQKKNFSEVNEFPSPVGGSTALMKDLKYPAKAVENGTEGTVYIEVTIDKSGNPLNPKVIKGFDKECDDAALNAVKTVKFTPGKDKNGNPVETKITIPYRFKLDCSKDKK